MTDVFVGCIGRDGNLAGLNPAWERALGYSLDALTSRPFVDFVHPADREQTKAELKRMDEGGETVVFESRWTVREDHWRWISWQAQQRDHIIYMTGQDVTDRIAEKSRQLLLERMVEGMDDAVFTETVDGVITSWNRVSEELFGYTPAEAIGRSAVGLIVPEGGADGLSKITKRLLAGEGVRQYTNPRQCKDGSFRTMSETWSLMRDAADDVVGVVVVGRDSEEASSEEAVHRSQIDKLAWVGRVRDAIDEGRIVFFAQPVVRFDDQHVSYELLCRMVGRNGEVILPGLFLSAAENYGLIEELDLLAIREAARQVGRGFEISVNLSTATIRRIHIVDVIAGELAKENAQAAGLTVEVTETAVMSSMASAERISAALTTLGVRLALDDFGTGFGGFTYLKKLDVHRLKIDIEFVRDLSSSTASQHVVRAVVALAEGFGLDTVAEGVEDEKTAITLEELGVKSAQGYYFSRPGPLDEILGQPLTPGKR